MFFKEALKGNTTHMSSFCCYLSHSKHHQRLSLCVIPQDIYIYICDNHFLLLRIQPKNSFRSTKKILWKHFFNLNSYSTLKHMWMCRKRLRRFETVVGFFNKLPTFRKLKFYLVCWKISQTTSSTFREIMVKLFPTLNHMKLQFHAIGDMVT